MFFLGDSVGGNWLDDALWLSPFFLLQGLLETLL